LRTITELELAEDRIYMLEVDKNGFRIIRSEKIPYADIWEVPRRKKAIRAFTNGTKRFFKLFFRCSTI